MIGLSFLSVAPGSHKRETHLPDDGYDLYGPRSVLLKVQRMAWRRSGRVGLRGHSASDFLFHGTDSTETVAGTGGGVMDT